MDKFETQGNPLVLLVDDEEKMHIFMKRLLTDAGYDFISARNGRDALEILGTYKPDLILLDVMMPGMSGFDVCSRIRQSGSRVPVVFLSAKGELVDKSLGFKTGGDDYVTKPFSIDELLLRIEAHIRRYRGEISYRAQEDEPGDDEVYSVGDLEIRHKKYEVRLNGNVIELTSKEFEILWLLASNPGVVFTRAQIYEHIWNEKCEGEDNSITVFIRKIREKIEENPANPRYILTVWRVGYKIAEE